MLPDSHTRHNLGTGPDIGPIFDFDFTEHIEIVHSVSKDMSASMCLKTNTGGHLHVITDRY